MNNAAQSSGTSARIACTPGDVGAFMCRISGRKERGGIAHAALCERAAVMCAGKVYGSAAGGLDAGTSWKRLRGHGNG